VALSPDVVPQSIAEFSISASLGFRVTADVSNTTTRAKDWLENVVFPTANWVSNELGYGNLINPVSDGGNKGLAGPENPLTGPGK
jgi:hypothetical protein